VFPTAPVKELTIGIAEKDRIPAVVRRRESIMSDGRKRQREKILPITFENILILLVKEATANANSLVIQLTYHQLVYSSHTSVKITLLSLTLTESNM